MLYAKQSSNNDEDELATLDIIEAGRLWYHCGMKLSHLYSLFEGDKTYLLFSDFLDVIKKIISEDKEVEESHQNLQTEISVGDKVELADGYQNKGDARAGPLQPGDRGTVVEVQQGPNGERHSVRALHCGRRWWYQPQAVQSERGGLIESSGIWFLHKVLRAHGYDHITLQTLVGKPVTNSSWECGDIVVPKKVSPVLEPETLVSPMDSIVGRIVPSSLRYSAVSRSANASARGADAATVPVEFVNENFIASTGLPVGAEIDDLTDSLETRRVRVSKLVHSTVFEGVSVVKKTRRKPKSSNDDVENMKTSSTEVGSTRRWFSPDDIVNDRIKKDVAAVAKLDTHAIEAIEIECKRKPGLIPSLFSAGLPDALTKALDSAIEKTRSPTPPPSFYQTLSALGSLIDCVTAYAYLPESEACNDDVDSTTKDIQPQESEDEAMDDVESNDDATDLESGDSEGRDSGRASTLQERRSMLLALMSRARRGTNGSLNELVERENGGVGVREVVPGVRQDRSSRALLAGFGGDMLLDGGSWEELFEMPAQENQRPRGGEDESLNSRSRRESAIPAVDAQICEDATTGFLWGVLQGGNKRSSVPLDNVPAAPVPLTRCLFNGLVTNSLPWVEAAIDMLSKRRPLKSSQSQPPILRNITDEDGVPVLLVAISLGCSSSVINLLIELGATVGKEELQRAAYTDQADLLVSLLRHTTYSENLIDLSRCTSEISGVFENFVEVQRDLKQKMNEKVGGFVQDVTVKLVYLALKCRHCMQQSNLWSTCSGAAMSGLLGSQVLPSTPQSSQINRKPDTKKASGLLNIVSSEILAESFFRDTSVHRCTNIWLLIEDHLYSKDVHNGFVGLSLLRSLLQKMPFLSSSTEMDRYGFAELVSMQGAMASKRLEHASVDSGTLGDSAVEPHGRQSITSTDGRILCPAKHVATLHVTRHSSFRCDLCGASVDRGRPMHGCRQCDWDACEKCTDQKTSSVKNTLVKDLAEECQQLLSTEVLSNDIIFGDVRAEDIQEKMSSFDSTSELHSLCISIQQEDILASQKLAKMLEDPGKVNIHQFSKMVLPCLHASLLGKGFDLERSKTCGGSAGRRSKRARVGGGSFRRAEVARETVKHLLGMAETEEMQDATTTRNEQRSESFKASSPILATPKIVEILQKILSFYEDVSPALAPMPRSALKSLTQPISIELCPSSLNPPAISELRTKILAEPLVRMEDIELHILRTCPFKHPSYVWFCQKLSTDQAIIVERPRYGADNKWRLGRVKYYDDNVGSHTIRYANDLNNSSLDSIRFEGEEKRLILASREYYLLDLQGVNDDNARPNSLSYEMVLPEESDAEIFDQLPASLGIKNVGTRVEVRVSSNERTSHTVIAIREHSEKPIVLVSDSGEVWESTPSSLEFGTASSNASPAALRDRGRQERAPRSFPFLSGEIARRDGAAQARSSPSRVGVLKRAWSALSLAESMRPIELNSRDVSDSSRSRVIRGHDLVLKCEQGEVSIRKALIRSPPLLRVEFTMNDTLPAMRSKQHQPLVGFLTQLEAQDGKRHAPKTAYVLYCSIKASEWPLALDERLLNLQSVAGQSTSFSHPASREAKDFRMNMDKPENEDNSWIGQNRSRKMNLSPSPSQDRRLGLCDGLCEICVQCMEVLGLLSELADNSSSVAGGGKRSRFFENEILSKSLEKELEDPLRVAGNALPDWCSIAPLFAPRIFSHGSRRLLLERSGFGISRSVLTQQEAKVNVARLRQRMAALRSRAVELVGEAFSGGAEDPTSLQLQADELYGMDDALGNRVKAAFRAEGWQEHALEVAKAAVERERLLSDAEHVMDKIALDDNLSSRRLEVRFENESGFDAAAGEEAGVTRGFYADIAEALLSRDNHAGVYCTPLCPDDKMMFSATFSEDPCKLPLFIPDMDSTSHVIIPTPRANARSSPGVFPRALSPSHPLFEDVLTRYRMIGRLFASSFRDGFMFPLPLSSSFLKLVQHCGKQGRGWRQKAKFSLDVPEKESMLVLRENDPADVVIAGVKGSVISDTTILATGDLPRPGFLGGELYAADLFICRKLSEIDAQDLPRSEREARYQKLAEDKNFAREALGKTYDCSFNDFFQDRTFVDPLDPTQGEEATPLCYDGHKKSVTIYNIRDYVALCKQFLLHDGVLAQAQAFRAGVDDFVNADYLRLFTPEELQRDVCGVGDNVDSWSEDDIRKLIKLDEGRQEALAAVAAMGGAGGSSLSRRFSASSPTIAFLVKALLEASPKQRRQFLSFVTSVPIVTPGAIEVIPIISPTGDFMPMQDPACLPRANTCTRRLYLPKFESYEKFAEVLWAVVREESKFKGFFEWRGN